VAPRRDLTIRAATDHRISLLVARSSNGDARGQPGATAQLKLVSQRATPVPSAATRAIPHQTAAPANAPAPPAEGISDMDWLQPSAVTGCRACGLRESRRHRSLVTGSNCSRLMVVGEARGKPKTAKACSGRLWRAARQRRCARRTGSGARRQPISPPCPRRPLSNRQPAARRLRNARLPPARQVALLATQNHSFAMGRVYSRQTKNPSANRGGCASASRRAGDRHCTTLRTSTGTPTDKAAWPTCVWR
jgi:hypothetical protein